MGDDSFISDKVRVTGTIKWPLKKFLPAIVWMFCQLLSFLPVSTHVVLKGVKTYQVLFDTKLLVITAHREQAVFLTITRPVSCSLNVSRLVIPPARRLSDCRKWHVDSAEKGSWEERRGCCPPTSQRHAESTSRRVSGRVLFSWGGSRLRLGEQKLSCSLPGVSTLSSDWIQYGSPPSDGSILTSPLTFLLAHTMGFL